MSIQYFIELAKFNIWANEMIISWLEQISDEQWELEVINSFNSIKETTLHIVSAEHAWHQRLLNVENIAWLQSEYNGTKEETLALWRTQSENLHAFVANFGGELDDKLSFKRLNGDQYSMPIYQVFAHVFNHSTYHRGQLVTMLRQVGFTQVSSTDLLAFYRTI
jgi:uncharacterized damage-inducible protein DinB